MIVVLLLTPRLVNLEAVKSNIADKLSSDIGGDIEYRQLKLSYFPRPHVIIHKAALLIPDGFSIKIDRLKIYPKLLPLLKGSPQIANIRADYADYFMKLPQISGTKTKPDKTTSLDDSMRMITEAVQKLPAFSLPDLKLRIKNSKVNLVDPSGRTFKLRQMNARYHRKEDNLNFSIQCKSNLWEQININGSLNPSNFKGQGKIQLSYFRPQQLLAYLFPNSSLQVTDTRANVTITFESDGDGNIEADVDGAIPSLQLNQGKNKLIIQGSRIRGKIQIGDSVVKATMIEFGLKDPQMNVTGTFSYDHKQRDIRLEINGSEIDATSVRQMALTLWGNSQTTRDIFNIIRGGQVPWINVQVQGHSMADLGLLDNIVIKGRMIQGRIWIPGAELDLEDVVGNANITKGILVGDDLKARLGKTRGQKGNLRMALNGDIAPFNLEIDINADLSQLPPVLNRIVTDKDFLRELDQIKGIKGTANGTLTLGDDLKNMKASVKVTNARFAMRYMRVPYPIEIDGGKFIYEPNRVAIDNFNAKIGKSSLGKLSTIIDWAGKPLLNFHSKTANFDSAELFTWLLSFKTFKKNLDNINSLIGSISVQDLKIKGPFFSPQKWHFQTRGVVNKIRLTSDKLPKPLHITSSQFSWQGTQIAFNDMTAAIGKSNVSKLSAKLDLGKASSLQIRSESVKLVAAEFYPWLLAIEELTPVLKDFAVTGGILVIDSLNLKGPIHHPDQWHYDIVCRLQDLVLDPKFLDDPVVVNNGKIRLSSKTNNDDYRYRVNVETGNLTWGANHLNLSGGINLLENQIMIDADVSADSIDWRQVKNILDYFQKRDTGAKATKPKRLIGALKFQTDRFNYEPYRVQPLLTDVSFEVDKVMISIKQAALCNISLQGLLKIHEQTLEIYLVPTATEQDLSPTVSCLMNENKLVTGTYNFNSELLSKSKPDVIRRSLSGRLDFSAEKGRIYRIGLLAKILAILNVTEIYRGELPDLTGEGFAYNSMRASAVLKGGKLIMKECSIDGVSMGLVCEGDIDIVEKKMDLTILVAPFKTVDRIVEVLPLISQVLGGKLISIPFKAKGDLKDPEVVLLPPKAVGSEVMGILERTLKLPITIIQPVLPKNKKQENYHNSQMYQRQIETTP
jgi:hypothetical protein